MGLTFAIAHSKGLQGKASMEGYDTVTFNPGDGEELVVYDPSRIISKRIIPYQNRWRVKSLRRRRGAPLNLNLAESLDWR